MNTTMADGAEQRLDAQIAEALFGQPGMSKMDVANRLRELRGDGPALLGPREGVQGERARFEAWAGDFYHLQRMGDTYRSAITTNAWQAWQAALSAQPSPGGQGALRCAEHCQNGFSDICLASQRDGVICPEDSCDIDDGIRHNHLAARQPDDARRNAAYDAIDRFLRANMGDVAYAVHEEHLETLFVARQPVGEPVAWLVHWSDMPLESLEVTRSASRISEVSALTNPPRIVPLYAAPPAQAVDLGAVCQLAKKWMRIGGEDARFCAGELLTLIDGKAVGK